MNDPLAPPRDAAERTGERGSALVTAIAVLFLLTAAGIVLLRIAQSETGMNVADQRGKQAFYLAESSIEQGREALRLYRASHGSVSVVGALATAAGANGVIDATPDTLRVTFDAAGAPTAITGAGDDVPLVPLGTYGGGWYVAYLTNDVAEDPGGRTNATTDTNKRVMLAGLGIGPDRTIDMADAVADTGPDMPTAPATITVLGDTPKFEAGSSGVKTYWGDDCRDVSVPSGFTSMGSFDVVGVTTAAALATVTADINGMNAMKQLGFQTGLEAGSLRTGASTAANITTNVWYNTYPEFQSCTAMVQMGQYVKEFADVILPPGSDPTAAQLGTASNPRVLYCEGNCELSGTLTGYGVIWVNGDFTLNGGVSWYGQIYVVGTGQVYRKGAGGGYVYGSMIIANTMSGACNGTSAGGFGTGAQYDMSGGGNSTTTYCSYYNNLAWAASPVKLRSFRER